MAELKTQPNDQNVEAFLNQIDSETKRQDSFTILELMKDVTGGVTASLGLDVIDINTPVVKRESGLSQVFPRANKI